MFDRIGLYERIKPRGIYHNLILVVALNPNNELAWNDTFAPQEVAILKPLLKLDVQLAYIYANKRYDNPTYSLSKRMISCLNVFNSGQILAPVVQGHWGIIQNNLYFNRTLLAHRTFKEKSPIITCAEYRNELAWNAAQPFLAQKT